MYLTGFTAYNPTMSPSPQPARTSFQGSSASQRTADLHQKRTRVLLIEDNPDDISLTKYYLADSCDSTERFSMHCEKRLGVGCERLAREDFDAVLLDLMLPHHNGVEVFLKVHELKPATPVIVLTCLRDEDLAMQAMKLGAQDYLIKGTLDGRLLKRAIRYGIERNKLLCQVQDLLAKDADGKLVIDDGGIVRYANPAAQALFGRDLRDLLGRPFPYPLPDPKTNEILIRRPDSAVKTAELRIADIEWSGAPASLLSLRDITNDKLVDHLRAQITETVRTAELKSSMLSCISHELRSPLTIIKMAISFLADGSSGPLTPRQTQFVDMAARNINREVKILDNNLDLARLQSGKVKIALRPVNLPQMIDELVQESRVANKDHELEVAIPPGIPPVQGDCDLLAQVLRNLLDNAMRFARLKVQVKVALEGHDGVLISVCDDGVGIPRDRLGDLFKKFIQLNRTEGGGGYKGTGLGLAICKEIVAAHHGRIWVESEEGQGTRFHLTLAKYAAPEQTSSFRGETVVQRGGS
jgi:signal transduction histidine kinase